MKNFVEFTQAKVSGHKFEYQDTNGHWKPYVHNWNFSSLINAIDSGSIRIEPSEENYCFKQPDKHDVSWIELF